MTGPKRPGEFPAVQPPKKGSGEHPAFTEANRLTDDTRDRLLPMLREQTDRLTQIAQSAGIAPSPSPERSSEWVITIRGVGPHHNNAAGDANVMAALFVHQLGVNGHVVSSATFDNGAREEVASATPPPDGGTKGTEP